MPFDENWATRCRHNTSGRKGSRAVCEDALGASGIRETAQKSVQFLNC